jgi:hypothetical protein
VKSLAALALLASATSAMAGAWVDDLGRSTEMQCPGSTSPVYTANGHSVADGVELFGAVCLKNGFDRAAAEPVVVGSGWSFSYRAEMMPFKEPVDIGGWNAPDATLRMANGIFFNKKPQCSLAFRPQETADIAAVQDAMSKLLGKAPENAAKQFDKSGKPKKYYTPQWSLLGPDGAAIKVFALPLPYNSGAIQIAALKN